MKSSIIWYLASFVAFMLLLVAVTFFRAWQVNGPRSESQGSDQLPDSVMVSEVTNDSGLTAEVDNSSYLERVNLNDTTERMLAVLECAGCHQEVYENWKAGPHAASYEKLMDSWDIMENSDYYPEAYTKWVSQNIQICFSCHASENVFETNFAGIEDEPDLNNISYRHFAGLYQMSSPRQDRETWSTGTDCFTCHYNGEQVITGPDFKPSSDHSDMAGYCNPKPSIFFTSNLNCNSCHSIHVDHTMRFFGNGEPAKLQSNESSCLSCHQEYDRQGKGTHYFFWRHDDLKKHPRKEIKGGIFEQLKTKVVRGTEPKLVIDWKNDLYPHSFSECGEVAVFIKVKTVFDNLLFETDVRLNRKTIHDKELQKQMEGEDPPGKVGYTFNPGAEPLHLELPLGVPKIGSGRIEMMAIDKGQYWADDAIGDTIWTDVRRF